MTRPATAVFLGSGSFAVPILEALTRAPEVRLAGVVTAPARPAGRHARLTPTPVASASGTLGIPVLSPARLRDPGALDAIADLSPELLVLADYGRILPAPLLSLPAHGALNLHPSLLPRHRGATPIPAAILAGDRATGVSLIRMDEGVDTGPVLAQSRLLLGGEETTPELEPVLADIAARLLTEHLAAWLAGTLAAQPQADGSATLTRPFRRDDGVLDAARPAVELERQVRALQPWPGTWLELPDDRLIVRRAALAAGPTALGAAPATDPVGTLVALGDGVALCTGDGWLELLEVQPSGARSMSGADWRRGRRDLPIRVGGPPDRPSGASALG